jgi:hypothetical protein
MLNSTWRKSGESLENGIPRKAGSYLSRLHGRALDEDQVGLAGELAGQPEERLLEVVVAASRNIVVLQVLLAVEGDLLGLDLAVLDVDLVTAQDDGDVLAHANEIAMPVGDIPTRIRVSDQHGYAAKRTCRSNET